GRPMVGAVEGIRDGLIDRDGHGLRRRVDVVAAVNGYRLASHVWFPPLREPAHLAHHPLDVRLGRPETGDARPHDRGARAEPDLRHPRGPALADGPHEPGGLE